MPICYNILGNEDPSLFACSDDGHPAHCCARDQLCASNGLCVNGPSEEEPLTPYTVGGCTVQDFEVDTCRRCYQGGVGIKPCGEGTFCCYNFNGCNCNNATHTFSQGPVEIISATTPGVPIASSLSTTGSSTSTTTPEFSPINNNDTASSNDLGVGLGIGLGLGIPLSLAVILGALFIFRRRKGAAADYNTQGHQSLPPSEIDSSGRGSLSPNGGVASQIHGPHNSARQPKELPTSPDWIVEAA
ncbi:uncharacterized protein BDV14DRAFT_174130 [Aspergillus stella-maris]|uniref:uncharacterized protein n=1 Tax=Aspergillus stella-maris TaxID=1810926 RepID=UPI003CCE4904